MNARLEANVLRSWRPGWRAGVLNNIATTSDIPSRRRRNRNRCAWRALFNVATILAAFWLLSRVI